MKVCRRTWKCSTIEYSIILCAEWCANYSCSRPETYISYTSIAYIHIQQLASNNNRRKKTFCTHIAYIEQLWKMASTVTVTEDQPNAVDTDATVVPSCLNDPNYAIICVFLQKFAVQLKIEHPDFVHLQQMIENTDEGRPYFYSRLACVRVYVAW